MVKKNTLEVKYLIGYVSGAPSRPRYRTYHILFWKLYNAVSIECPTLSLFDVPRVLLTQLAQLYAGNVHGHSDSRVHSRTACGHPKIQRPWTCQGHSTESDRMETLENFSSGWLYHEENEWTILLDIQLCVCLDFQSHETSCQTFAPKKSLVTLVLHRHIRSSLSWMWTANTFPRMRPVGETCQVVDMQTNLWCFNEHIATAQPFISKNIESPQIPAPRNNKY